MRRDRYGYSRYDYYDDDYFFWSDLYAGGSQPVEIVAGATGASMDFTEADGADLVNPGDEFEKDMTES